MLVGLKAGLNEGYMWNNLLSPSHLEASSTSMGSAGYCHSPVIAVKHVNVRQPVLLHISSDGVRVS